MKQRQPAITLRDVTTGYLGKGHKTAITTDINAELYPSELTCLLGPNGAGKSTLLKTLSAFLPPLAGEIIIEGRPLENYTEGCLSRTISVVLTERIMLNNMSVYDLVSMGRSPYTGFWGRISPADRLIVDRAIDMVGIGALRERQIQTLSDGERQKVMIAKSLAQETPIVFLDEPTAFLDYPSKVEIMQLLLRLTREKGKTVFLSTHDLELALQIADRIWLVDKKHGLRIGTPEDLSLDGEMSRFFEREGVRFDIDSGLFRIDNQPRGEIRLIGDGPRAAMAAKALRRLGIDAHPDSTSPHTVFARDSDFEIDGISVRTIAELINTVGNLPGIGDK